MNEICAPGSSPGVGFIAQVLFSLFRHCLTRYDFGIPSRDVLSSWMKVSSTANLSIRNNTVSTFPFSSLDKVSYRLALGVGLLLGVGGGVILAAEVGVWGLLAGPTELEVSNDMGWSLGGRWWCFNIVYYWCCFVWWCR